MSDERPDGGRAVARALDDAGIEAVFTLVGGNVLPILSACEELGLTVVDARNEASAGFMAAAWAVLDRTPGVCVFSAGPGHTNAYTAFTQANEAGYPLVSLSGGYEREAEGKGALQEVDQVGMVEQVSKWATRVERPDRLARAVTEALRRAKTTPTGHAHLTLPRDVLSAEGPADGGSAARRLDLHAGTPAAAGAEPAIDEAVAAIAGADRPVVVAGGGVWFADAGERLRRFVELTGVPVFTHEEARGLVPDSHELCFGSPLFKLNGASRRLADADCVVLLGVTLDWRLEYGEPPMLPAADDATFVRVDDCPERLGANVAPDVGVVADANTALAQLARRAEGIEWERPDDWLDALRAADERFDEAHASALSSDETPIHPARLCADLAAAMDEGTRVVFDGGNVGKWGKLVVDAELPGRWLRLKGPFAAIGYGLPAALGAQLWAPDDDVVLLTGDGAFGYNVMDVETAVVHDLPVTCVVANNGAWGSVGGGSAVATRLPETPFHALAADLGAAGESVTDPAELRAAFERGLASREPYVIDVRTANPSPPAVFPETVGGY